MHYGTSVQRLGGLRIIEREQESTRAPAASLN